MECVSGRACSDDGGERRGGKGGKRKIRGVDTPDGNAQQQQNARHCFFRKGHYKSERQGSASCCCCVWDAGWLVLLVAIVCVGHIKLPHHLTGRSTTPLAAAATSGGVGVGGVD